MLVLKKVQRLVLVGICSLCAIFYMVTMFQQDLLFSEYKKSFRNIQHPAGTEFIKAYDSFGALDKIRVMYKDDFAQGCDYRIAEVREYSDIKESIKAFYAGKRIRVNGEESSIGILFIPVDLTGLIDPYGLAKDEIITWGPGVFDILEILKDDQTLGFLKLKPQASYYYVSSGGFSLSSLDFRCQ